MGMMNILALVSGLVILGESPSALGFGGIFVVLAGTYLLSFSQRKRTEPSQAEWLGFRGIILLLFVCTFWISGLTIQGFALRRIDPVVVNMTRLLTVSMFLNLMALAGGNDILVPLKGGRWVGISRRYASVRRMAGMVTRKRPPAGNPTGIVADSASGIEDPRFRRIPAKTLIVCFLNGGVSQGLGTLLFLVGLQRAGLAISMILMSTQLLWITIFAAIILKEKPNRQTIGGIVLMFVGALLILS